MGVYCGFPGSLMGRSDGIGVAWYVGVFVAVPCPAPAGSPGPPRSEDAFYGVGLRL
jgi:hypothetical protein